MTQLLICLSLLLLLGFAAAFIAARCDWLLRSRFRFRDSQVIVTSSTGHVLYLRSFREDDNALRTRTGVGRVGRERYLADVLREVGPVLAVGRPGEVHPPYGDWGAERIYFRDDEWHEKILKLIKSARLIVLAADITGGLHWEIAQVVTHVQAEKLIVAPPYGRAWLGPIEGFNNRNARAKVYERFRTSTEGIFPVPLP